MRPSTRLVFGPQPWLLKTRIRFSQPLLVDLRRGADSLAALVGEQLWHDAFSGTIFIFRPKRASRLKILARDGSVLQDTGGTSSRRLIADTISTCPK